MYMKPVQKLLAILLSVLLLACSLAGCARKEADSPSDFPAIRSLDDIHDMTVAVAMGTTQEQVVPDLFEGITLAYVESNSDVIVGLETGRFQAVANDYASSVLLVAATDDLMIIDDLFTTEEYAFILNKQNTELKKKLDEEGLFERSHKKPLPLYPERIAIITSEAGAAVHDMIKILGKRWPMTKVLLLPVRVQGVEAPSEIVGAIRYANKYKLADVIITGRGGGSIEDLWAFNDERVARAIYDSEIPVISAVGHEPDVTISDYVADARASTPSNAAEIVVPDRAEQEEELESFRVRLAQAMNKRFSVLRGKLDTLSCAKVLRDPAASVDFRRMELDRLRENLLSAQERQLSEKKQSFIRLTASLDAMSPLKVLSRGYCTASDAEGKLIKSASQLSVGDRISVRVSDGTAGCTVNTVIEAKQE